MNRVRFRQGGTPMQHEPRPLPAEGLTHAA